jgi:hypothetical protein
MSLNAGVWVGVGVDPAVRELLLGVETSLLLLVALLLTRLPVLLPLLAMDDSKTVVVGVPLLLATVSFGESGETRTVSVPPPPRDEGEEEDNEGAVTGTVMTRGVGRATDTGGATAGAETTGAGAGTGALFFFVIVFMFVFVVARVDAKDGNPGAGSGG